MIRVVLAAIILGWTMSGSLAADFNYRPLEVKMSSWLKDCGRICVHNWMKCVQDGSDSIYCDNRQARCFAECRSLDR
jgi:hypothetical protein